MVFNENIPVNSFYTIVNGLFRYDINKVDEEELWSIYFNWRNRINNGNYQGTFDYLNHSYLNNIFPEIRFREDELHSLDSKVLNHLTLKKCLQSGNDLEKLELYVTEVYSISFRIEYIDLYIFPHGIGIFSIKVSIAEDGKLKLGKVSDFLNQIRHLQNIVTRNCGEKSIEELIMHEILSPLNISGEWTIYNPQLKLYTILDFNETGSREELERVLFDIGNMSPIGSAAGDTYFAPSEDYYNEQIQYNRISVFRNWMAMALYDTFTRVSINVTDSFNSWQNDYFNLYIHTIYSKFFMYLTNSELSEVTRVTRNTELIRDRFIEFVNDYQHTQVSYKFLPDLIRDKLIYALGIQAEVERMDVKIQRINEQFQEKREKSFNTALVAITLLSVFSVIYDLSEWSVKMGIERSRVYPIPSIIGGFIIFGLIFLLFRMRRK
ncbi:MAG: hypothetical protein K9J30_13020 [Bacteroidales bacterium]|nr:hypothetical protein [Bacteroidales bacterium]